MWWAFIAVALKLAIPVSIGRSQAFPPNMVWAIRFPAPIPRFMRQSRASGGAIRSVAKASPVGPPVISVWHRESIENSDVMPLVVTPIESVSNRLRFVWVTLTRVRPVSSPTFYD